MAKKAKDCAVQSEPEAVYQLKVTLDGIRPLIWRRIQVRGNITLFKLHKILQVVMGWQNYHLHQFLINGECYSVISVEADMLGDDFKDEKRFKLSRVVPLEKIKFTYEYDFGDGWDHTIQVEKISRPAEELKAPVCIDGKRSAPPEDCGGKGGYHDVLKALRDPSRPKNADLLEWLGKYDPEHFDANMVNQKLAKIR
ncbi:MAG: Plasmid pRiA4b ORF-3-like protein [Methanosaeta sp. PtaU1.Bin112]|nr:MAG: Plasmid pRiA4b ORF-3-like protein [Methanosaeta sp. PtaU1.Bin112]